MIAGLSFPCEEKMCVCSVVRMWGVRDARETEAIPRENVSNLWLDRGQVRRFGPPLLDPLPLRPAMTCSSGAPPRQTEIRVLIQGGWSRGADAASPGPQ